VVRSQLPEWLWYFQKFAGHDYLASRGTLADALIALLGGAAYKTQREHQRAQ